MINRSAVVSPCSRYRYTLDRWWGRVNTVVFIMLNPSTADADLDDATIRRCMGFARGWWFTGITVVNLFAFRSTNPLDLKRVRDPIGPENNEYIERAVSPRSLCVAAWGNHGTLHDRDMDVTKQLRRSGIDLWTFGLTKAGCPRHPLYQPSAAELVRYNGRKQQR